MKIREVISAGADLSGIIALGFAFYALVNPGAVTDYIKEVRRLGDQTVAELKLQTEQGEVQSDQLRNISEDTQRISENIPFWVVADPKHVRSHTRGIGDSFQVVIGNPSTLPIQVEKVVLRADDGSAVIDSDPFVLAPLSDDGFHSIIERGQKLREFCIIATLANGETMSERRLLTGGGKIETYDLRSGKDAGCPA